MRGPRRFALAGAVLAAALGAALDGPVAASGAAELTLGRRDAPGLRALRSSPAGARAAIGRGLPGSAKALLRRTRAEGARFSRRGLSLRASAVVLGGERAARRLLVAWGRRARRAHRLARVRVGADGVLALRRSRRGTDAAIAWRRGPAVGLVELRARSRRSRLAGALGTWARLADARLRVGLRTGPFERILLRARRGRPSKADALRAFAMAVAPLPGVRAPRLRHDSIRSATPALRWIDHYRPQLTAAQRAAVDFALARLFGGPAAAAGRARGHAAGAPGQTLTPSPEGRRIAEQMRDRIAAKWGRPLSAGVFVAVGDRPIGAATAATRLDSASNVCRIIVTPLGAKRATSPQHIELDFTLAHEVFHCFQRELLGRERYNALPDWQGEGLPEWVAYDVTGITYDSTLNVVLGYVLGPRTPLFSRSYDAAGFFGHADEIGINVWAAAQAISSGNGPAAYAAVGGGRRNFLDTWGASLHRRAALGPDWTMRKPIAVGGDPPPPVTPIVNNGAVGADAYTTAQYSVTALGDAPVLHVDIGGNGRIADGTLDTTDVDDAWFCTIRKCECPKDSEGEPPPTLPLKPVSYLALTGAPNANGSGGTITAFTLKQWCRQKRERPKPQRQGGSPTGCGGGSCGSTNGDPHLTTIDRLRYDFQAAGEFVLARATSGGGFEVQARQEPFPGSDYVSINTAVAMRVGPARVQVDRGDPLGVRVDGRRVRVIESRPLRLRGGGRVSVLGDPLAGADQVEVAWADGSLVRVWGVGSWGVALLVEPAPGRAGRLAGLLGNFDGDRRNDLVARNGRRLDAGVADDYSRASYAALYRVLGDSWRLRSGESLFAYGRGRSTRSYDVRGFPRRFYTVRSLSARARRAAEAICRRAGITDPDILEGCILDTAVTGEEGFAEAASVQQTAERPPGPVEVPDTPVAWSPIAALAARSGPVGLGVTPDGALHLAATVRSGVGDRRDLVHVPVATGGAVGPATTIAQDLDGEPDVAATAAGGLRVTVPSISLTRNQLGTFTFDAPAAGDSWAQGQFVTPRGYSYVGRAVTASGPGGVQFTVLPNNGFAGVWRGIGHPIGDQAADPSPGSGCYSWRPSIASDGSDVWVAFIQWGCADVGYWVARIDPATGALAAPRSKAPESSAPRSGAESWIDTSLPVALAARPGAGGVWMAYGQPVGSGSRILLWRIGAPAPIEVARLPGGDPAQVTLDAEPSGRLWIAWVASGRLFARRTAPDGGAVEGPVYRPALPAASQALDWAVRARAGGLDLVAGHTARSDAPGATWHGVMRP